LADYCKDLILELFFFQQLLLALGGPLAMGWLIIFSTTQVYLLCLARFMMGLSMGGVSAISPVYVSEIAESKIRGELEPKKKKSLNTIN
jgi:MFS family permease